MEMNPVLSRSYQAGRARRCAAGWFMLILALALGAGAARAEEIPVPETAAVEAAEAQGNRLTAEEAVVEGKRYGVKSIAVFTNPENRIRVPVAGLTGYGAVCVGDGVRVDAWRITCATADLYALMRVGNTHHAAVLVSARKSSWPESRPDVTMYLWISAYDSRIPAIRPSDTAPRQYGQGDPVAFATGIPDAEVTLVDGEGNAVTTAMSDENGDVVFDAERSADGLDHPASVTRTFGNYDPRAATAYASDPANLLPAVGGTGVEWVAGNDCATYQSRVLTAGGFPVYAVYASKDSSPGGSIAHVLRTLLGEERFLTEFTAADLHEGDLVWEHNMRHVLYCAEVDPEAGTVHTYGHSTRAESHFSDNGWGPIAELNAVFQMVYDEEIPWDYRIDGLDDPRLIRFDAGGGSGVMAEAIRSEGDLFPLPENGFEPPAGMRFAGWRAGEDFWAAGANIPVTGHMTVTACWREEILDGVADLALPAGTARVEAEAFAGVAAGSVYIPDGCASIGAGAFRDCPGLARIRIPAGCEVDPTAFTGCGEITVFGTPGSPAEALCTPESGLVFAEETPIPGMTDEE